MKRRLVLLYGIGCYLLFNAVYLYLYGFLLDLFGIRSTHGEAGASAIAVNLGLVALFGFAHSLFARDAVKAQITRIIPAAAERSTFVLQSCLLLGLVIWQWREMPAIVWSVDGPAAMAIYAAFGIGSAISLWATYAFDHYELFGLRQAWDHQSGKDTPEPGFRTPFLYRVVRHPMQTGLLIALWAAPTMTVGHLVFAASMSAYVLVGLHFEERSLLKRFGETYAAYRRSVPMLIPRLAVRPVRQPDTA